MDGLYFVQNVGKDFIPNNMHTTVSMAQMEDKTLHNFGNNSSVVHTENPPAENDVPSGNPFFAF